MQLLSKQKPKNLKRTQVVYENQIKFKYIVKNELNQQLFLVKLFSYFKTCPTFFYKTNN